MSWQELEDDELLDALQRAYHAISAVPAPSREALAELEREMLERLTPRRGAQD